MQVERSSRHLQEQLPHWGAELSYEEHLARRRNGRVAGRIDRKDRNSARVANDVAHVLITAGALNRCATPLHVCRLHHQVRRDDDLVEITRL